MKDVLYINSLRAVGEKGTWFACFGWSIGISTNLEVMTYSRITIYKLGHSSLVKIVDRHSIYSRKLCLSALT